MPLFLNIGQPTTKRKSNLKEKAFFLLKWFFGECIFFFCTGKQWKQGPATWINFACDCVRGLIYCLNVRPSQLKQNDDNNMEVYASTKYQAFKIMFIWYLSKILNY